MKEAKDADLRRRAPNERRSGGVSGPRNREACAQRRDQGKRREQAPAKPPEPHRIPLLSADEDAAPRSILPLSRSTNGKNSISQQIVNGGKLSVDHAISRLAGEFCSAVIREGSQLERFAERSRKLTFAEAVLPGSITHPCASEASRWSAPTDALTTMMLRSRPAPERRAEPEERRTRLRIEKPW